MKPTSLLILPLVALLTACGGLNINVWPFGGGKNPGEGRKFENATEYKCAGGRYFFVRSIDSGAAMWLIYPDRQVRLDKLATGSSYGNGVDVLSSNGDTTTLTDGSATPYSNCKPVTK